MTRLDEPRKVKYITRSNVPSATAKVPAFYNDLCYVWVTSEQLARFDHQRGNQNRADYLDELMDFADDVIDATDGYKELDY